MQKLTIDCERIDCPKHPAHGTNCTGGSFEASGCFVPVLESPVRLGKTGYAYGFPEMRTIRCNAAPSRRKEED